MIGVGIGRRRRGRGTSTGPTKAVFSGEIELTGVLALPPCPLTADGRRYDEATLLVRVAGEPVGFVRLPIASEPLSDARVWATVERDLGVQAEGELERRGLPPLRALRAALAGAALAPRATRLPNATPTPSAGTQDQPSASVTVVICTRNRAGALGVCLESLRALEHERLELVIVDNAPADDSTRELIMALAEEDPRFRYVREPHPGLSWARNRGLNHAVGEIVAYTDDDVRVDRGWIAGLLRGFDRRPDVACVTGLVASASLEHATEQWFDERVWWSSSCQARVYDARNGPSGARLHPYAAGGFGTGANFAFRTEAVRALGGFDETLGAGSSCAGGEDLDMFVRLLRRGHAIAYEPAALVWHEHRIAEGELRRQMHSYGKALAAYLFKYASSRHTAVDVWRRLPRGLGHLGTLGVRSGRAGPHTGLARALLLAELRGAISGPLAYARARRAQDSERRRMVAP